MGAPQIGLLLWKLADSPSLVGRKACRSRHSSAVKRHFLLGVAQNLFRVSWNFSGEGGGAYRQVAVLTNLKGSFAGAPGGAGGVGITALTALAGAIPLSSKISSTYNHRVNLVSRTKRQLYLLIQPHDRHHPLLFGRTLTLRYFIPFGGIADLECIQSIINGRTNCTSHCGTWLLSSHSSAKLRMKFGESKGVIESNSSLELSLESCFSTVEAAVKRQTKTNATADSI